MVKPFNSGTQKYHVIIIHIIYIFIYYYIYNNYTYTIYNIYSIYYIIYIICDQLKWQKIILLLVFINIASA